LRYLSFDVPYRLDFWFITCPSMVCLLRRNWIGADKWGMADKSLGKIIQIQGVQDNRISKHSSLPYSHIDTRRAERWKLFHWAFSFNSSHLRQSQFMERFHENFGKWSLWWPDPGIKPVNWSWCCLVMILLSWDWICRSRKI
jgi:hypothetical protein